MTEKNPRIEELALMYETKYIRANQTSLLDALVGKDLPGLEEDFGYDNVVNFYVDASSMDIPECLSWLDDNVSLAQNDAARVEQIRDCDQRDQAGEVNEDYDADDALYELRALVEDAADADGPAEILEWYLVDSWLARHLAGIGECVLRAYGCEWWGRRCSGQRIIYDGVLQKIAQQFVDE